jgi:hypothetical protein
MKSDFMNNQKYVLILSKNQLQAISVAIEVLARLKIGQIKQALDQCLDQDGNSNILGWEIEDQVESIVKPHLGLDKNQSWGVGKFKIVDLLWDLYEVIRYKMSWDNALESGKVTEKEYQEKIRNENIYGVNYNEPMHWNHDEDLVKVYSTKLEHVSRIYDFFD